MDDFTASHFNYFFAQHNMTNLTAEKRTPTAITIFQHHAPLMVIFKKSDNRFDCDFNWLGSCSSIDSSQLKDICNFIETIKI